MDIEIKEFNRCSGIAGLIKGKKNINTIALRADMDALPIKEETGLAFASTNNNMHACGHDAHMAILLGAAQILKEHKDELLGSIKLIFQPGEEKMGGAKIMVEEGVLNEPKVDAILGLHVGNFIEDLGKFHAFDGGDGGLKFPQDNGVAAFLGEDVDPETGQVSQGVGKITGTGVQQICQEPFVVANQIQGEDLGLKGGEFKYRRLHLNRHEHAGGLHLQWLANRQVQVRNVLVRVKHGRNPVINLCLFHQFSPEKKVQSTFFS